MVNIEERELLFSDRSASKQILREVLEETAAKECGIVRSGGGRPERAGVRCAVSFLFRKPDELPKDYERGMRVGAKELMVEFQPGEKPPTYLKARIVPGEDIDLAMRIMMEKAFLSVKSEGLFEKSYLDALREVVRRFVNDAKLDISQTDSNIGL